MQARKHYSLVTSSHTESDERDATTRRRDAPGTRRHITPVRGAERAAAGGGTLGISPSQSLPPSTALSSIPHRSRHSITRHANTNCTPSPLQHSESPSPCSPHELLPARRLARRLPALLPAPAAATTAPRAPSSLPEPRTTNSTASVPISHSTLLSLASSGVSCHSSKCPPTWPDGGKKKRTT